MNSQINKMNKIKQTKKNEKMPKSTEKNNNESKKNTTQIITEGTTVIKNGTKVNKINDSKLKGKKNKYNVSLHEQVQVTLDGQKGKYNEPKVSVEPMQLIQTESQVRVPSEVMKTKDTLKETINVRQKTCIEKPVIGRDTCSKNDKNPPLDENTIDKQKIDESDVKRISYAMACKETKPKVDQSQKEPILEDRICYLKEIDENLFNLPEDISLAHCVAEDLRMGDGIAMEFKRYFSGIGQLFDQNLTVGNVGVVFNNRNETAFYLVTKKYSGGKSTMESLSEALKSLLQKMKEMKLSKLGIPKIGCGWDGLNWAEVKALIASVFAGSRISITVCVPSKIYNRIPPPQLKTFITSKELLETKEKSDILLFIDIEQLKKNNWTNDLVDKVNVKYPSFKERLLKDIRSKMLCPGDMTYYLINNERINCLFISPTAYYSSLEKGFTNMKKYIRSYRHFVFQSGPIKPADNFKHISRMVLIMRSIIYSSELWLCGDKDLTKETEVYDNYCRGIINEIKLSSRQATVSNRPKAGDWKQNNTPTNNRKRKNAPPRKNFQRR